LGFRNAGENFSQLLRKFRVPKIFIPAFPENLVDVSTRAAAAAAAAAPVSRALSLALAESYTMCKPHQVESIPCTHHTLYNVVIISTQLGL
jgi:hypothetical protein